MACATARGRIEHAYQKVPRFNMCELEIEMLWIGF